MNAPTLRSMHVFAGFAAGVFFVIACPDPTQAPAMLAGAFGPPEAAAAQTTTPTVCPQWSVRAVSTQAKVDVLEPGWEPFAAQGTITHLRACVR